MEKLEDKSNMLPFLSHLESLRWHIVRSIISILIGAIFAFLNKSFIFDKIIFACKENDFPTYTFLCNLSDSLCIKDMPFILMNIEMAGQFMMHILVSVVGGIIVSFPYILFLIVVANLFLPIKIEPLLLVLLLLVPLKTLLPLIYQL